MSRPVTVIGGKLKLKGMGGASTSSSSSSKKRKAAEVVEVQSDKRVDASETSSVDPEDLLTPAERRFLEKKKQAEIRTIKSMNGKSFRERVEEFNSKLSATTEHNDIPRVSAAGNG